MESFFHSFSGADRFRDLPLGTWALIYPPEKTDVSSGCADFLEMGEELQIPA
jgi:hypothetical protein